MSDSQTGNTKKNGVCMNDDAELEFFESSFDILEELFPSLSVEGKIMGLLERAQKVLKEFLGLKKKKITGEIFKGLFDIDRTAFKQAYFPQSQKDDQIMKTIEQSLCRAVVKHLSLQLPIRVKSDHMSLSKFLETLRTYGFEAQVRQGLEDMEKFLLLYFEKKKVNGKDLHESELTRIRESEFAQLHFELVEVFLLLRIKHALLAPDDDAPDTRHTAETSPLLQPHPADPVPSVSEDMVYNPTFADDQQ